MAPPAPVSPVVEVGAEGGCSDSPGSERPSSWSDSPSPFRSDGRTEEDATERASSGSSRAIKVSSPLTEDGGAMAAGTVASVTVFFNPLLAGLSAVVLPGPPSAGWEGDGGSRAAFSSALGERRRRDHQPHIQRLNPTNKGKHSHLLPLPPHLLRFVPHPCQSVRALLHIIPAYLRLDGQLGQKSDALEAERGGE